MAPRFDLEPLPATNVAIERLKAWFRRAVEVRDADGAERVLQTAIASGAPPTELADMLLAAATDHVYLDAGHVLDFINKACEYLDLVGWSEARLTLPSLVDGLCRAQRSRRAERLAQPDRPGRAPGAAPRRAACARDARDRARWATSFDALVARVLEDDPSAGAAAISAALDARRRRWRDRPGGGARGGAAHRAIPDQQRVRRLGHRPQHVDFVSGAGQALARAPSVELARGLYHAAMRIYLDRFLNVPAARLPDEQPRSRRRLARLRRRAAGAAGS